MTKKEKFEVAVARFEAALNASNLSEQYFLEFSKKWLNGNTDENYAQWVKWAKKHAPYLWLLAAFDWDKTSIEQEVWQRLDHVWLVWICGNLNK